MIALEGIIRLDDELDIFCLGESLNFQWRGRKTADLEPLRDDGNRGYVVFTSMHECWGVFLGFEEVLYFTGKKVDRMIPSKSADALADEYVELDLL